MPAPRADAAAEGPVRDSEGQVRDSEVFLRPAFTDEVRESEVSLRPESTEARVRDSTEARIRDSEVRTHELATTGGPARGPLQKPPAKNPHAKKEEKEKTLKKEGLDTILYNVVLKAFGQVERWDRVMEVWEEMLELGVRCSAVC
jgi:pentatricopeptide repeat protein